jgi:N,N'-diacetyllegionaminate synthase
VPSVIGRSPFVLAEAAQGFEGSAEIARLLVRAAVAAKADAVKFQVVFADDLAVPGYAHYQLFQRLEMPESAWRRVRNDAEAGGIGFYVDVLGPRALALARRLGVDGAKLHSTCFFEHDLTSAVFSEFPRVLLSIGGIDTADVRRLLDRHPTAREKTVVLHGFQAEPTPTDANQLARIPGLARELGLEVGFMDHADGAGPDVIHVSAMALALGCRTFEKHVGLDRGLELEDFVSALAPGAFATYVETLRRLAAALGDDSLVLSPAERGYRERALKRVVAARDLEAGRVVEPADVTLLRPAMPAGLERIEDAVGRTLMKPAERGAALTPEHLR